MSEPRVDQSPATDPGSKTAGNGKLSIGSLAKRSASWVVLGQVASQVLSLGSNIVLARLLFPEAFGIAAIVGAFLFGLAMLSDAGIGASIVQNKRGDDPRFLRTAWSMQVVRGFFIGVIAVLIAEPVSVFYEEPDLFWFICAAALGPVTQGFASVSFHVQTRKIELGAVVRMDVITQCAQTAICIAWAVISPSVWALIGGTLVGHLIRTTLSHFLLFKFEHAFCWDKEAVLSIFQFGRWILLSSALTFVVLHTDRVLVGHYLDIALLGVYSIGLRFSEALNMFQTRLTYSVLFPLFSHIEKSDAKNLVGRYYRVRFPMEAVFLTGSAVLMIFGGDIINLLFDERYAQAGWMLQFLAIQTAMSLILTTQESLLFSMGYTYYGFARNVAKAIWIVVGIPVAFHQFGLPGIVWCVALSEVPTLFVIWFGMVKHQMLRPLLELRALIIFGFAMLLSYFARNVLLNWSIL